MRPSTIALLICFFLLISSGCSIPETRTPEPEVTTPEIVRVWPPPPQTARIKYVRNLSGPHDLGIKKSWFKQTMESIFGAEEVEERMVRPYGVFAGADRVYVTDAGAGVLHVFDMRGKNYFQISEIKKEELVSPIGVAADKNGYIYLSDSVLRRVFVFNREGEYLKDVGSPELFLRPAGLAVDEERVYVVDTHGHRVLIFSREKGDLLFSFGRNGAGKGDFNYPTNIFVGKDGFIYITDSMNFRVQIFGKDGHFISSFGRLGDGSGDFSKPKGIAVDSEGHIYVADAHFDNVQIFDRDGRLLLSFGSTGQGPGEMILPAGLFIDEKDMVYVADSYNGRVQVFQYLKEIVK